MSELTEQTYILALDVGTSSVRAAIYNEKAERMPESFVKNERTLHLTEDGGADIDAEEALAQVVEAIDDVIKLTPELIEKVRFVAMSCFWHSLVGVDENGKAVTPVFGWADTRSKEFVKVLQANFDETETHNRTGARFHSSYWAAKLLWLKSTQPQIFQQVKRWLSFSDFFVLRFLGENVTSVSMASGTGIFDFRRMEWDAELLDFIGISLENLPQIESETKTRCGLRGEYAARYPQLQRAQWLLAIGDGAANNVGANCVTKDKAALMVGTSGAMRVVSEGTPPAEIPAGLWCYRLDNKRVIIGGALSDGGGLYHWLKDALKLEGTDNEIEDRIAENAPDSHGLTFLPFLAGERSTNWNAEAKGAILGLHSSTSSLEITQAALEAVAYRFAAIFGQLNEIYPLETIIASGGALRESPVWTQIICDALNKKMFLPDEHEASSRGAVLFALEEAGKIQNLAAFPTDEGQAFMPDAAKHEIYRTAKARQEKFYKLLAQ